MTRLNLSNPSTHALVYHKYCCQQWNKALNQVSWPGLQCRPPVEWGGDDCLLRLPSAASNAAQTKGHPGQQSKCPVFKWPFPRMCQTAKPLRNAMSRAGGKGIFGLEWQVSVGTHWLVIHGWLQKQMRGTDTGTYHQLCPQEGMGPAPLGNEHAYHPGFGLKYYFSTKRNQGSLEKRLHAGPGKRKYKLSLDWIVPEEKRSVQGMMEKW